jgi:hypothetical protein
LAAARNEKSSLAVPFRTSIVRSEVARTRPATVSHSDGRGIGSTESMIYAVSFRAIQYCDGLHPAVLRVTDTTLRTAGRSLPFTGCYWKKLCWASRPDESMGREFNCCLLGNDRQINCCNKHFAAASLSRAETLAYLRVRPFPSLAFDFLGVCRK